MTPSSHGIESTHAWIRMVASTLIIALGASAMYANVVMLPALEAEFGISRGMASLPYSVFMLAFGLGGIAWGWVAGRFGIVGPILVAAVVICVSDIIASRAESIWTFALVGGVCTALFGASITFSPLIADLSHWFQRRRGLAVSIVFTGSYIAGALWPPVLQYFIDRQGWRDTLFDLGIFVMVAMVLLSLLLLPRAPATDGQASQGAGMRSLPPSLSNMRLQSMICIAGIGCCVAMAMPQVHVIPYAIDLGLTAGDGATMVAVMLGFGIISRLMFGMIMDRIGGLNTLMVGSVLQAIALGFFLTDDSLVGLYAFSAIFGLTQGGIVPSYAIIVRDFFPAAEAGWRVGLTIFFTTIGMSLGGWSAGALRDVSGDYTLSFVNAILFNLVNAAIVYVLIRQLRTQASAVPA